MVRAVLFKTLAGQFCREPVTPSFDGTCLFKQLPANAKNGGRSRTRTCNPELRRLVLSPVELCALAIL